METKKTFKFSNGDKVKETVTGFTGTITGTCFYLTGCDQYLVADEQIDRTKEPISKWYDEQRLELVESKAVEIDNSESGNGPDLPAPNKG